MSKSINKKRFERYRDIRMNKLKLILKNISYMSSKRNYDYSDEEAKEIVSYIKKWSSEAIEKFERSQKNKKKEKKDWSDDLTIEEQFMEYWN
jgi:cytochrome c